MAVLQTSDLALLLEELKEVTEPHILGINLGISPDKVKILIQDANGGTEREKSEVVEHWLKNDNHPSWSTLIDALKKSDHVRLAERLKNKYAASASSEAGEMEVDNLQAKRATLRKSERAIKIEYGRFLCSASKLMEEKKVKLADVKVTWSGYDSEMSREACEAKDISSFLMAIRRSQGPYTYENITDLLKLLCNDEGEKLASEYEEKLKKKLRERVQPVCQTGKKFKVKIDKELSREDIVDFRITLATLFNCKPEEFILEDIHEGCIELFYVIPSDIAEEIQKCIESKEEEDFRHDNIVELWIESEIIWKSYQQRDQASTGETESKGKAESKGEVESKGETSEKAMEEGKQPFSLRLHPTFRRKEMESAAGHPWPGTSPPSWPRDFLQPDGLDAPASPPYFYLPRYQFDAPPTLPDLIHLGVVRGIGQDYYIKLGILLLNDATGQYIEVIEKNSHNFEQATLEIFRRWLEGKGLPVTWRTLIKTLRHIQYHHLAHMIETMCR